MTSGLSFLNGISFYLNSWEINKSTHHEVIEFITDHPPEPNLYKPAPREINVSGFLFGPEGVLSLALLLKITKNEEKKTLFLPAIGFSTVYCLDFRINESGDELGTIEVSFTFVESSEKPSILSSTFIDAVESLNDVIDNMALAATAAMQPALATVYGISRVGAAVDKVVGMCRSAGLLGMVPWGIASALDVINKINNLKREPSFFVSELMHSLTSGSSGMKLKLLKTLPGNDIGFGLDGFVAVCCLSSLPAESQAEQMMHVIDILPTPAGQSVLRAFPGAKPNSEEPKIAPTLSLLAAHAKGDLLLEETIAKQNRGIFACSI